MVSAEGTAFVRNLNEATRIAARVLGPALERAQRTGAAWGLYVSAGEASALFGAWAPAPASSPQVAGPQPNPSTPIARIYDHWRHRDGSPLGALEAAAKIIAIYAERRPQAAA